MANKSTINAAIKGSIAHPEAANKVIAAIEGKIPVAPEAVLDVELEGFDSEAGTVADGDKLIEALSKLDGNTALKLTASKAAAVADIPTPASATSEACALKINALLASLRTAGILTA